MTAEPPVRLVDAIAALGNVRLRQLAAAVDAPARADDPRQLAAAVIEALDGVDDLRHQNLSDADVEAIGTSLGLGARADWRPRVSAEEFERLPFYSKPSYDQDVWDALRAGWPSGTARHHHVEGPIDLAKTFVHLGRAATITAQEPFTGTDWYERYAERTAGDGVEGRLVSVHTFVAPWDSWEMHSTGHELVVCMSGRIVLVQEQADGSQRSIVLEAGQAAINAPGVWHTADVDAPASALFITAAGGTQHRPRTARPS